MENKEKTKNVVQSSVQQKSFRTQNVVQTDGQEIRAFALPCLFERSPIAYCAKFEQQFGFTHYASVKIVSISECPLYSNPDTSKQLTIFIITFQIMAGLQTFGRIVNLRKHLTLPRQPSIRKLHSSVQLP